MSLYKHVRFKILYQLIETFPFIVLPLFTQYKVLKIFDGISWEKANKSKVLTNFISFRRDVAAIHLRKFPNSEESFAQLK